MNEMTLDQIETRSAEIDARNAEILEQMKEAEVENLSALEDEARTLNDEKADLEQRKAAIMEAAEQRQKEIAEVLETGEVKNSFEEKTSEERKMTNAEVRNSAEYINAFANYIKSNDDAECRSLLTENNSGTVPVPELVEEIVRTAWDREGIMSRVKKSYVRGNLKVGFERSASAAEVHTEGAAAPTEETLTLGTVTLIPESIKKWITISDEAMDMGGEAFLRYIYEELTYQIAKKAAGRLIDDIKTLTTSGAATAPAVGLVKATQITLGLTAKAIAQLAGSATDLVIAMNRLTFADFKAAQYGASYAVDPFEGCAVEFTDDLPAFSAASSNDCYAIVGDFANGAQANFPNGEEVTLKIDDKSLAEQDLVKIVGREYVAVKAVAPKHFCKIVK